MAELSGSKRRQGKARDSRKTTTGSFASCSARSNEDKAFSRSHARTIIEGTKRGGKWAGVSEIRGQN